jgi:hypothetical protein
MLLLLNKYGATAENLPSAFGIAAWAILIYIVLRVWWEVRRTGENPDSNHWPYK